MKLPLMLSCKRTSTPLLDRLLKTQGLKCPPALRRSWLLLPCQISMYTASIFCCSNQFRCGWLKKC